VKWERLNVIFGSRLLLAALLLLWPLALSFSLDSSGGREAPGVETTQSKPNLTPQMPELPNSKSSTAPTKKSNSVSSPSLQTQSNSRITPEQARSRLDSLKLQALTLSSQAKTRLATLKQQLTDSQMSASQALTSLNSALMDIQRLQTNLAEQKQIAQEWGDRLQNSDEAYYFLQQDMDALQAQYDTLKKQIAQMKRGRIASPILFGIAGVGVGLVALPNPQGQYDLTQRLVGGGVVIGSVGLWALGRYLFKWW
jgi:hypothetical protein